VDRRFWSSNYPIDTVNLGLAHGTWMLRDVLDDRFDEDKMLRGKARRAYRLSVG
jgi:predicted TIM-barrel fold metal-dependent hydrolase